MNYEFTNILGTHSIGGGHHHAYEVYSETYNITKVIFITQEGASIHRNIGEVHKCLNGELSFSRDSEFLFKVQALELIDNLIKLSKFEDSYLIKVREQIQPYQEYIVQTGNELFDNDKKYRLIDLPKENKNRSYGNKYVKRKFR